MFDIHARDRAVANFRRIVYDQIGFTPFEHQADWQLASEGWSLQYAEPQPGDYYTTIGIPDASDLGFDAEQRHQRILRVRRKIVPRLGDGTVARYLADLAANKAGKSYGTSAWLTGFAVLPNALVQLIGAEYGICEHEFTYLCEFLCSERGMNLKYKQLVNDKRNGRMRLELKQTGMVYECKSWDNQRALKGAKVTCFVYCEAYMLPGMECFTSIAQNIRQLRGWAVWPTTADRPWVGALHDMGHGENPEWHCTCGIRDDVNPVTFDQRARDRDDPDKGGIMTREKFEIIHNGKLGAFAGRVYDYVRGQFMFTPQSHPQIWKGTTTA